MSKLTAEDIKRVKGLGCLKDKRFDDIFNVRVITRNGKITSAAKDPEEQSVYEMYYDYEEPIKLIKLHRVLAINRGENEKVSEHSDVVRDPAVHGRFSVSFLQFLQ